MYDYIINPETLRKVKLDSKKGKSILNAYRNEMYGGKRSFQQRLSIEVPRSISIESCIAQDDEGNSYDIITTKDSQDMVLGKNVVLRDDQKIGTTPNHYQIEANEVYDAEHQPYHVFLAVDTRNGQVIATGAQ